MIGLGVVVVASVWLIDCVLQEPGARNRILLGILDAAQKRPASPRQAPGPARRFTRPRFMPNTFPPHLMTKLSQAIMRTAYDGIYAPLVS